MDSDRLLLLRFVENHPADAARILEGFQAPEATELLEALPSQSAAPILELMSPAAGVECLAEMGGEKAAAILSRMELDSAAGFLRRMEPELRTALLETAPVDFATPLRLLLRYPVGTAGSFMDPRALAAARDVTISDALDLLKRSPRQSLHYLYVIDRKGRLVGVTDVRELLGMPPEVKLEDRMKTNVSRLPGRADRSVILAHPGWSQFHALPVVDEEGRFLGAIRYETLRRLETEAEARGSETPVSVAVSLGELFWVGLSGLLEGLGHVATRPMGTESRDGD